MNYKIYVINIWKCSYLQTNAPNRHYKSILMAFRKMFLYTVRTEETISKQMYENKTKWCDLQRGSSRKII
jgi:hypothetical protein